MHSKVGSWRIRKATGSKPDVVMWEGSCAPQTEVLGVQFPTTMQHNPTGQGSHKFLFIEQDPAFQETIHPATKPAFLPKSLIF